jgi:dTDP-4-amino-4,6-dideoxy-D-galactose acyltransferase
VNSYVILSWDSDRFGFPVARLSSSITPDDLAKAVEQLRAHGVRLGYLSTAAERALDEGTLSRYGGSLVDRRITYVAEVSANGVSREVAARTSAPAVAPYAEPTVTSELRSLARQSGEHSRFRTDPRVPAGVFESIYDAWITRSVRLEIADEVSVVRANQRIVGLITLRAIEEIAEIGLLVVDASSRGQGYGRSLVRYAGEWGRRRGLTAIRVVTQRANQAACALYESCGYVIERIENVYHFWL